MRSVTEYQARPLYERPLHQPARSVDPMYACACRWSVMGILLSLNGGVMKPMWNGTSGAGASGRWWVLPSGVCAPPGEAGRAPASIDWRSRVPSDWIWFNKGRSVDD